MPDEIKQLEQSADQTTIGEDEARAEILQKLERRTTRLSRRRKFAQGGFIYVINRKKSSRI